MIIKGLNKGEFEYFNENMKWEVHHEDQNLWANRFVREIP